MFTILGKISVSNKRLNSNGFQYRKSCMIFSMHTNCQQNCDKITIEPLYSSRHMKDEPKGLSDVTRNYNLSCCGYFNCSFNLIIHVNRRTNQALPNDMFKLSYSPWQIYSTLLVFYGETNISTIVLPGLLITCLKCLHRELLRPRNVIKKVNFINKTWLH